MLYIFACCCDLNKVYMYTVGSKRRPWVPVTSRGGEGGGREGVPSMRQVSRDRRRAR